MKLFEKIKKFFNSAEPENDNKITMSTIMELFSRSGNAEYGNDLSEVTYFTCLKTLAESVAKIPIYLLDSDKNRIMNHETIKILQFSANEYQTPAQFLSGLEYNRNHLGNGYAYCERYSNGKLKSLIPLDPNYVQVWINDTSNFTEKKYYYFYQDSRSGKSYWLNPDEVIHVKSWITEDNGIVGRSVREILARLISGSKASNKFLSELYDRGLIANLCVRYVGDLKKESQKKLLQGIEEQAREDGRKMFTIPIGFDIVPLDLKLTDSQFLEIRQFTALQIAAAFGVKPNFLNDFSKSSYANSIMQQLTFLTDTLLSIITYYEQEFNRKLLTVKELEEGLHFKFNVGVLLRNNPTEQADIIQKLVQSGVYSTNDARRWLDQPPIGEEGDQYLVNGSMVSLKNAGAAYKQEE